VKHSLVGIAVTIVLVGGSVLTMLWESFLVGLMFLFMFIFCALVCKVVVDIYNKLLFVTTAMGVIASAVNMNLQGADPNEHKETVN
jgi:prepilin signal peptidase PulO-like enzyme (type II secretory pathway)